MTGAPALDPLFAPGSVAVVGASPDSWYSSQLMDNLLGYGYDGDVYPVNPNRDEAWDRTCYDDVADVPEVVDLVVVSVPREYVVEVVETAGERGVPAALVITAGFAEADDRGSELEAELAEAAVTHGIRVCGPNCIGLMNAHAETTLTTTCSRNPEPGSIGLVSQSGALAFTTFFERARDVDLHFSHIVSTGNEADLDIADYVSYLAEQPTVDVICVYAEGVSEPRRFVRAADRAIRNGTPVLAVKIGESEAAEAATLSHTGSVAGNDDAWEGAFAQVGVQRVPDIPDLLGRANAHATLEPPTSDRVCVVSTSGGLASLLADMVDAAGLSLPSLTGRTERTLLEMEELLTFGELNNPIDVRGYGADILPEIAETLFDDNAFDAYVFAIGLSAVDERAADIAADLRRVGEVADEPVVVLWTGRKEPGALPNPQPYERVRRALPLYEDPQRCIDALASLVRFNTDCERTQRAGPRLESDEPSMPSENAQNGELPRDEVLTWNVATRLLDAYDIDSVPTHIVSSADEAATTAEAVGWPTVCKVDAPALPHRSAVGAVRTDVRSKSDARTAHEAVLAATRDAGVDEPEGVLVQPQVEGGVEALVGVTRDPSFGPLVTVGSGGTLVELLDDTVTRVPPILSVDAIDAIEATRVPELLAASGENADKGVRQLAAVMTAVGDLVVERPAVVELDLNPIIITADDATAVDVLLRTR
jgi:acetate---CoA ligase (ADP-forming)